MPHVAQFLAIALSEVGAKSLRTKRLGFISTMGISPEQIQEAQRQILAFQSKTTPVASPPPPPTGGRGISRGQLCWAIRCQVFIGGYQSGRRGE